MAINDFLPFATGAGANVENQATYASDPSTSAGFSAGIAQSGKLNKVWRQSSFISAAVAQFVMQELGVDVLDDGDLTGFTGKLQNALTALQPRQVLYSDTTFYVNATIGSDSATGLSPSAPWRSLQHASDTLAFNTDANNKHITVNISDGVYQGFVLAGAVLGSASPAQIVFSGNLSNPQNVVITPRPAGAGNCVTIRQGGALTVQGMRVSAPTPPFAGAACQGIVSNQLGRVLFQNIDFAACLGAHLATSNGFLHQIGSYSISGGAPQHINLGMNSTYVGPVALGDDIVPGVGNVTLTGSPAFSDCFIRCGQVSYMQMWDGVSPLMVWSGAATGVRFRVSTNSTLDTAGQSLTWLPGNTAGVVDATTYGVYR